MRDAAPQTIYLADYTPFGFVVEDVSLTFDLAPNATRVTSRISFAPNPEATDQTFFLHGEQLKLNWARMWRLTRRATPPLRGSTNPQACIARNARPKGSAKSPITPTAPM